MQIALYGPGGFFEQPPVGARGHFVTAPHVHPFVFAHCVRTALLETWHGLGEPDPFRVVELGAGDGTLAEALLQAFGELPAPSVSYTGIEISPGAREALTTRGLEAAERILDLEPFEGVVLANELLDNLPVRIVERVAGGWQEVLVTLAADGSFEEMLVAAPSALAAEADAVAAGSIVPDGARLPVPDAAVDWLDLVASVLRRGEVLVLDYAASARELVERGASGWLRTYRGHQRGTDPLEHPGAQDITIDVPTEHLAHAAARAGFAVTREETQADFLTALGIDDLVEEGRAIWQERAHLGDLEAIAGRSRIAEAAALTDPAGLGAHRVIVLGRHPG
jgi:NADH dehydrogenase [ubiquinone] 1 alpha subcomplex assembly factor 7